MWINSLSCFVLAAIFCSLLTPVFRSLGMKMRIYSVPGGRNINKSPISRLGGASVFFSFIMMLCVIFFIKDAINWNLSHVVHQSLLVPLLCGAACMWLLGLLDDIWDMRARYKLLVQIAVAVGMHSFGLKIQAIHFPILGVLDLGDYSLLFTVLWIVGTINAVNFIDGIDGLCSSVALCSFLGIFCLAMFSGVETAVFICSAMAGCMLVFLIFNFQPASIFLGDSGAYFLGFMIAGLSVFIASRSSPPGVFHFAFIVFMIIPLIDTGLAILRRLLVGIQMSTPDREHLHHKLLEKGYTHKKIMATMSLISLVFIIAGVAATIGNRWQTTIAVLTTAVAVCLLLYICDINSLRKLKPKYMTGVTNAVLLKEYAPSFFHDLARVADWTQARKILDDFSRNTDMREVKITRLKNGIHEVVWSWRDERYTPCRRSQLCKTYEVNHSGALCQFYFCWTSDYNHIQNDTSALLEVISKTIHQSLIKPENNHEASSENLKIKA